MFVCLCSSIGLQWTEPLNVTLPADFEIEIHDALCRTNLIVLIVITSYVHRTKFHILLMQHKKTHKVYLTRKPCYRKGDRAMRPITYRVL